jgi:DNA-binding transcriptional LysR family regulator
MVAAADELGVSVAAISRSLSRLEQKCGFALLNNRGSGMWKRGGISLTPGGAVLHAEAAGALRCLEQAFRQAAAAAASRI